MASRTFFDPIRLLRIAPLITSTGTLVYATSELIFNTAFLESRIRRESDAVLPIWYSKVFKNAIWLVVGLNMLTTSTAMTNGILDHYRNITGFSTRFYWVGLAVAFGHMMFIPGVAGPINNIIEDKAEEGATSEMAKWLRVHRVRMLVADFPAWLSFLGAVMTRTVL